MFESVELKKRNREKAYWEGVEKARSTGFAQEVLEGMTDLILPYSLGADEYKAYKQGYADVLSGKISRRPSPTVDKPPEPLDISTRAWYALCEGSEFLPAETVKRFKDMLFASGQQVAFMIGLNKFTNGTCPKCGASGQFRIRFLGQISHPDCQWRGFMGSPAYVGHQIAQIFHTGIRAGGAIKDEADKKKRESGNWVYALFGFCFVGVFRATAAGVLIPVHCLVASFAGDRTASQRVTTLLLLGTFVAGGAWGVYQLRQNMPVAPAVANFRATPQGYSASSPPGSKKKTGPLRTRIVGKWYPTQSVPGAFFMGFVLFDDGRAQLVSYHNSERRPESPRYGTWSLQGTVLNLEGTAYSVIRVNQSELVLKAYNIEMGFSRRPGRLAPF